MWSIINKETGRTFRDKTDFTDVLVNSDGGSFGSKLELVNYLNTVFLTAGRQAGAPAADTAHSLMMMSEVTPSNNKSLYLRPFTESEILNIFKFKLASKNTSDIYDISVNILKEVSQVLAPLLVELFNRCLKTGCYPRALKKVKIAPIYKGKGEKSSVNNYRPISIIPALAKVLEVGVNSRLIQFFNESSTFTNRQYAYRAGRSTTELVREVFWNAVRARGSNQHVAIICCDLSRAFDTADRELLRKKLEHYGVRGPAAQFMTEFVSHRIQIVVGDAGKAKSDEGTSDLGVPQGSCLSNTAFSVLLNDLPTHINDGEVYMFADDVVAVVTDTSAHLLREKIKLVASGLRSWFQMNGLSLNLDKTCFVHFDLANRARTPVLVDVDGATLQQVSCVKLLGFYVDSALKWDKHINHLCARLSQACYALSRLAKSAPRNAVRSCYFATVHSLLMYGTELWGDAAESDRVLILQKRAIRAIAQVPWSVSAKPYFTELGILTVTSILIYQVSVFTYVNQHNFQVLGCNRKGPVRGKNQNKFKPLTHKLDKASKSVYVRGPVIYNHLPDGVRSAASVGLFKKRLRTHLINNAYYSLKEFFGDKYHKRLF